MIFELRFGLRRKCDNIIAFFLDGWHNQILLLPQICSPEHLMSARVTEYAGKSNRQKKKASADYINSPSGAREGRCRFAFARSSRSDSHFECRTGMAKAGGRVPIRIAWHTYSRADLWWQRQYRFVIAMLL